MDVRLDPHSFKAMWATPPILCGESASELTMRLSQQGPVPAPLA